MKMRINKTVVNLVKVWEQLDNAESELYNALDTLDHMVNLPEEMTRLRNTMDVSHITSLKNKVEELFEEKAKEQDIKFTNENIRVYD
jgi:hypothetical protein